MENLQSINKFIRVLCALVRVVARGSGDVVRASAVCITDVSRAGVVAISIKIYEYVIKEGLGYSSHLEVPLMQPSLKSHVKGVQASAAVALEQVKAAT
jgi:hypothetical protein